MSPRRMDRDAIADLCRVVIEDTHLSPPDDTSISDSERAAGLNALAHPARLRILALTVAREDREVFRPDLTRELGIGQRTTSGHLDLLVEAGLLARDRRGKAFAYYLVPERLLALCAEIA